MFGVNWPHDRISKEYFWATCYNIQVVYKAATRVVCMDFLLKETINLLSDDILWTFVNVDTKYGLKEEIFFFFTSWQCKAIL